MRDGRQTLRVTNEQAQQIRNLLGLTISTTRGLRVDRSGYHFALAFTPELDTPTSGRSGFAARITDHIQFGTVRRWKYAFEEVLLKYDGTVSAMPDGRKGTIAPEQNYALNLIELLNVADGAGVQGNSVDESRQGFPATFDLQPVGSTKKKPVIVQMWSVMELQQDGSYSSRPVFAFENAHDGACP